jgi:hypothetical protein
MAANRPLILCVWILGSVLGSACVHAKSLPESPTQKVSVPDSRSSPVDAIRMLPTQASGYEWTSITRAAMTEMIDRSSTFSEMMDRLAAATDVLLYMTIVGFDRGPFGGSSRFEVAPSGVIVAHIEIGAALHELGRRVRGVAHELAHAFEVMCLRPHDSTEALRRTLAGRAVRKGNAVETPFAHEVEAVVFEEWLASSRGESRLEEISLRYGLTRCYGLENQRTLSASAPPSN